MAAMTMIVASTASPLTMLLLMRRLKIFVLEARNGGRNGRVAIRTPAPARHA